LYTQQEPSGYIYVLIVFLQGLAIVSLHRPVNLIRYSSAQTKEAQISNLVWKAL